MAVSESAAGTLHLVNGWAGDEAWRGGVAWRAPQRLFFVYRQYSHPAQLVHQNGNVGSATRKVPPAADRTVMSETTNETGRFQRWQKIAIDQLTYALNLFLVLTVATLGYWFSLLRDPGFMPSATAKSF